MPLLGQERARFALEKVRANGTQQAAESYKRVLRKLPGELHVMGLGQTVAVLLGGTAEHASVCQWLEEWLRERRVYGQQHSLIDCITGSGGAVAANDVERRYREASAEARELAVWLKRFAEAFL